MAITVGTGTVAYSEGASGVAVSKPSGVSDGDWLIAVIGSDTGSHANLTAPAGWTLVTAASHDNGGSGATLKTFTRQVSGDGSSYTFGHQSGVSTCCSIVPIFGAGGTPTFAWAKDVASATETAPSVTAGDASDALICWLYIPHNGSSAAAAYSPPSGMTELVDSPGGPWSSTTAAALAPIGSSGATGTKDFSVVNIVKGTPEVAIALAIGDGGGGGTAHTQTPTDTTGSTDTRAFAQGKTVADASGSTDARALALGKVATDVAGSTDSVVASLGRAAAAIDSTGLTDSAVLARGTVSTDSAGITDTTVLARSTSATDAAGLTDSVTIDASGSGSLTPTDTTGLTDATATAQGKVLTDAAGVADSASLSLSRVTTDAVTLTDSATVENGKAVTATDTAGMSDAVVIERFAAIVDDPGLTDLVTLARAIVAAEAAGLTDSVGVSLIPPGTDFEGRILAAHLSTLLTLGHLAADANTSAHLTIPEATGVLS